MAKVAYTTIRHGKEDGSVVVVNEGDKVTGLPSDVVKDLEEQGLVGEPVPDAGDDSEVAKLRAELEAAQAELAEARAAAEAKQTAAPAAPQK